LASLRPANINPEGNFPSVFEPVHGSAPDIAGQGHRQPDRHDLVRRNDAGNISARKTAAASIVGAIERTLGERTLRTRDLGGNADTQRVRQGGRGRWWSRGLSSARYCRPCESRTHNHRC